MLGLSWTEVLVVGIVALIVIGPKDLPVVMGKIGKFVGQIQRMGRDFQREINKTTGLDEVRNLRNSITNPLKQTADEIRREFNAIGKDGQQSPTGVLKPTDPKVESVADAIKEKAGMTPAKSSTELAGEYGFKPSTPPAKPAAAAKAPAKKAAKPKAAAAEKAAEPVKAARPRPASKSATTKTAAPAAAAEAKPPAKPRAKPAAKPVAAKPAAAKADAPAVEKAPAARKPRAPRKKPAETAEKS